MRRTILHFRNLLQYPSQSQKNFFQRAILRCFFDKDCKRIIKCFHRLFFTFPVRRKFQRRTLSDIQIIFFADNNGDFDLEEIFLSHDSLLFHIVIILFNYFFTPKILHLHKIKKQYRRRYCFLSTNNLSCRTLTRREQVMRNLLLHQQKFLCLSKYLFLSTINL